MSAPSPNITASHASRDGSEDSLRRSPLALASIAITMLLAFAALIVLGTWQVHRRAWKLDLIARVDARVRAAPSAAPGPADWPTLTADTADYRHVTVRGRFLNDRETDVQALTGLGSGFWVLTPFHTDEGFTLLVNRGFVPPDLRDPASRPTGLIAGEATVTGLLRSTEPKGTLLQGNDPGSNLWYSRDVEAIAAARGLGPVAPYFIDADATPNPGGSPVGGLTVIAFPNNHLIYALTWYGLAAMLAAAAAWMVFDARRRRRRAGTEPAFSPP